MEEEKQDASYFNFGGFSHDDMHPTLDRDGSVPNTKSIKVSSQDNIIGILRNWVSGLQKEHSEAYCVQDGSVQHPGDDDNDVDNNDDDDMMTMII